MRVMDSIEDSEDVKDPMVTGSSPPEDASPVKQARGLDSMFDDIENEELNAADDALSDTSEQRKGSEKPIVDVNLSRSEVEQGSDDGDEDGLFGSGSDDEGSAVPSKPRQLDDEELDSGDDEHRNDRAFGGGDGAGDEEEMKVEKIADRHLGRHHVPQSASGEVFMLKFPYFLKLDHKIFNPKTFKLPEPDPHPSFPTSLSRFAAATNIIRWRHSSKDPNELESDSRILVWSDGSMTLQIANNPRAQFPLPAKPLIPPSMYSPIQAARSKDKKSRGSPGKYDPRLDAHMYLTAPHESALLIRFTNHVTTALSVLPSSDVNHESLSKLQASLAAAKRVNKQTNPDGTVSLMELKEDPELAKKRAEIAERDRFRQQKKLAASVMRETERANRTLAKSGLRTAGGGLSVSALEGDDALSPRKAKHKRAGAGRRGGRGRLSDSDDDDMPRGRTREDEYDKTDDFIVDTDEEEEGLEGDGDDDDEEILDDASEEEESQGNLKSPKRKRSEKKSGSKKDKAASSSKKKKRRISKEDEDDG